MHAMSPLCPAHANKRDQVQEVRNADVGAPCAVRRSRKICGHTECSPEPPLLRSKQSTGSHQLEAGVLLQECIAAVQVISALT